MNHRTTAARLPLLLLPLLALLHAAPARAQDPVSAGAAVAGVVLAAIQGLSAWVNAQDDDCYVAGLGAAWGKDCDLRKNEEQDTGYWSAYVNVIAENDCAHGRGAGLAQEGAAGSWSHQYISPSANAWTLPLHAATASDKHNAKGWGKAGVDGHCKSTEEATPDAVRGLLAGRAMTAGLLPRSTPPIVNADGFPDTTGPWPAGTIVAIAYIASLNMSASAFGTTGCTYTTSLTIDGAVVWSGTASISGTGAATLTGGLSAAPYTVTWNPATSSFDFAMAPFQFEYIVGTLGSLSKGAGLATSETTTAVHLEGEMSANAEASAGTDIFTNVSVPSMHTIDGYGIPLLNGRYVQVTTPLTVASRPNQFDHQMGDFHLFDPASTMSIGVIDFNWPSPMMPLVPGQRVMVRGYVTQHDGRTVLVDPEISPMGAGPLPPMLTLPLPQVLLNPEQYENAGVQVVEELPCLGTEVLPNGDLAVLLGAGPLSLSLRLDQDAGPWPVIQPGTRIRPAGFLLQSDPDEFEDAPTDLHAASIASPGYFEGYYLRPRHAGDLVLNTAGVSGPLDPVAGRPRIQLAQNRPNPFFPATTIAFRLEDQSEVRLRVFTVAGQLVKTLLDGPRPAGSHEVAWDGTDDDGRALASGLYVCSLEAGGIRETKKMILSR